MAASRLKRPVSHLFRHQHTPFATTQCRTFAATPTRFRPQHRKETFGARLGAALGRTKIEWYWIPATAGVAFLGGVQFYRVYAREQARKEEEDRAGNYSDGEEWEEHEPGKRPKKRKRIRPSGPWLELNTATTWHAWN
jgi:phosphatidylserine decarboxylase